MDIRQLLTETVYMKASDLHLCPGQPPKIRVNGDIINLNSTALDKETIEQMNRCNLYYIPWCRKGDRVTY